MVWESDCATLALRGDTCCLGNIQVLPGKLDSTRRREWGSPNHVLGAASGPDGRLEGQGDLGPADPCLYIMEQHQLQTHPFSPPCKVEGCPSPPILPQTLGIPKVLVNWKQTGIHKVCGLSSHFCLVGSFSQLHLFKSMHAKWQLR